MHAKLLSATAALVITAHASFGFAAPPVTSLLTLDQQAMDRQAITLLNEPAIKAAREAAIKRWSEWPAAKTEDGKATIAAAVDEMIYHSLRAAAADNPSLPRVAWTLAPPYALNKAKVPGSRVAGDNTDRIYRYAALTPGYKYEIRGQRGAKPARHEFSFEATDSISLLHGPQVALYSRDVDVAADGSFVITADSSPTADGQRNHLTLPAGTEAVLFRDTVPDWATDYNRLTVVRLDGELKPQRSREELVADAVRIIGVAAEGTVRIFDAGWKHDANTINPFVRPYNWGVPGNVIGIDRFSLQKDEALVFTLAPTDANYLGVQLTDAWSRSIDYWHDSSSLSDQQTRHNADGSITYVLSAKDPGVYNWLNNKGVRDGIIITRWEKFTTLLPPGDAPQLVREVRKVKMSELASVLPKDMIKTTAAERRKLLKARYGEFIKRVALK